MNKVYFPNLNGLRFIAALLVIIHHAEQLRSSFGMENYWKIAFVRNIGQLGVILFFVLSGFLITYLLLKEKNVHGTIFVKQFYIRRVLRIWPLYYFIVILSFFILPLFPQLAIPGFGGVYGDFVPLLLLFLVFLPNVALVAFGPVAYASQAWSVGVEEQFYLIWPWVIKKSKNIAVVMSAIIFAYVLINFLLANIGRGHIILGDVHRFWEHFNIDCMAIGGLAAWLLFYEKKKILDILYNPYLQVFVYLFTIACLATGFYFPVFVRGLDINCECYAALFAYIILNMASNPKSIVSLENRLFGYLGNISYGLYMYHVLAIVLVIKFVLPFTGENVIVFYSAVLALVVLISALSYELLEKRFIRRKLKYSKIISGANADENAP